jgi:hypothetical protein
MARRSVLLGICLFRLAGAQEQEQVYKFGTTVFLPGGLRGVVYHIPETDRLPNFRKLTPVGVVYTSSLNVPSSSFQQGFPGVTTRFEWFAIDYTGRFWIDKPGRYTFALASDDGSKLYIDDKKIVDNDGVHAIEEEIGHVSLKAGIHKIHVSYFQGPRFELALILKVAGPGESLRIFSTDEFKPPPNLDLTDLEPEKTTKQPQ